MKINMLIYTFVLFGIINVSICDNEIKTELDSVTINANNTGIISEENLPNKNAFQDWLSGLLGHTTTTTIKPVTLEPPNDCLSCSCGIANKRVRIVGGQETEVNQYPWMSMLLYSGRFYCGSTLINDRYVLTAAHCVQGFRIDRITVRFMEHDTNSTTESQTIDRNVLRIVKHKNYNPSNYNSDIALVRLDSPVEFINDFRPACLATPGKSFTGKDGVVTGWGATKESGSIATKLQEVTVPIISNIDCRATAYASHRITENMLCAGYKKGEKDSCQGDSGGPLHVVNMTTSSYQIVGVVSWGEGCAKPNYPGVYTRVNRYGTWIKKNTADACYCD